MGSGLSVPYLSVLGNVEVLLSELTNRTVAADEADIIRASIYNRYFDSVIAKNLNILKGDPDSKPILANYGSFLATINSILLRRKSTILSKQINLFTTNVDVFIEKALEELTLEYNDGFNGRFRPTFSLSNFKKSRSKRSLHYENVSELPVFNLLKLHGSLAWGLAGDDRILFSGDLAGVAAVQTACLPLGSLLDVDDNSQMDDLIAACSGKAKHAGISSFIDSYEALLIVNPTKDKFRQTVLNENYYELLRIFSNELERENTVLFAMGFSFADEHIRSLTIRAANSNPTLLVCVFAYNSDAKSEIEACLDLPTLSNQNIEIMAPSQKTQGTDDFKYDLATMNTKVFDELLKKVTGI